MNREISARPPTLCRFEDIHHLFNAAADPGWGTDRDQINGEIRDPWEPRDAE